MKVKCPWCGASGTDQKPRSEDTMRVVAEITGRPPEGLSKAEKNYAFEVRGNYAGRPVRKCLKCGNGVRVTFLPPRYRQVPPDEWDDLQERWKVWKTAQEAEIRALRARQDEERARLAESQADE